MIFMMLLIPIWNIARQKERNLSSLLKVVLIFDSPLRFIKNSFFMQLHTRCLSISISKTP